MIPTLEFHPLRIPDKIDPHVGINFIGLFGMEKHEYTKNMETLEIP